MHPTFLLAALVLAADPSPRTPVLVELFTSEGCSSCPAADALLAELLRTQPLPGVELVGLSEHVEYWNHLGWRDPFSAAAFTARQTAYDARLSGGSTFTPQVVVDGAAEAVGSDRRALLAAAAAAAARPRGEVRAWVEGGGRLQVRARWPGDVPGEVVLAVVDREAHSEVTRGENRGRRLAHAMVVRSLTRLGEGAGSYLGAVPLPAAAGAGQALVVFVQAPGGGPILAVGGAP